MRHTGLDAVRERLAAYLTEHGVEAVSAWPERARPPAAGAVAAVSLRRCEGADAGFGDYLGERYNEETGRWEELYGKRLTLTFGLDLFAGTGEAAGERQVRSAFDRMNAALQSGGPKGLKIRDISCGETVYDRTAGRYRCPVEAVCEVRLYAAAEEGGAFLDFQVKGAAEA